MVVKTAVNRLLGKSYIFIKAAQSDWIGPWKNNQERRMDMLIFTKQDLGGGK